MLGFAGLDAVVVEAVVMGATASDVLFSQKSSGRLLGEPHVQLRFRGTNLDFYLRVQI